MAIPWPPPMHRRDKRLREAGFTNVETLAVTREEVGEGWLQGRSVVRHPQGFNYSITILRETVSTIAK